MIKVKQMTNDYGRGIPNQFIIKTDDATYFQSYKSIIAKKTCDGTDKITLDKTYWDYSKTTAKYRNRFLGMTTQEIKKAIKSGQIELVDLNSNA